LPINYPPLDILKHVKERPWEPLPGPCLFINLALSGFYEISFFIFNNLAAKYRAKYNVLEYFEQNKYPGGGPPMPASTSL
jgi:hypothetical protein